MKIVFTFYIFLYTISGNAQEIFSGTKTLKSFAIEDAVIYVAENDFELVKKSALLLQQDIELVTGKKLAVVHQLPKKLIKIILIGSKEQSPLLQHWIKNKKIKAPKNLWEAYTIQSIENPDKNISNALVISGNDRRGTAYGVFEISRQMGVSPWYWWADVPVTAKRTVFIKKGLLLEDAPKVKYRGIFINDEAPCLSNWSKEKFGGFNHSFYEKVFELILRLKGNYLWPAMWGNAFNDDDKLNPVKADEWGIVMGTSHHEPMLRAQQEWKRYGSGKWNYDSNTTVLQSFWKKGIENMGAHESIVTVGMRGDGDEPMTNETATALLEKIVKDQREIIRTVTGKPAHETPQLWALYKEVQDYYDKGMRVPDDVTLLLCDDNWGNLRKLPALNEPPRKGGYGIYYHFDYVGGPRNYKWLNTNSIPRVWEQMHLAWEYNARQIWIVNVGDIKPMEYPISFFLDYAWNPEKINANDIQTYTEKWAAKQFGATYAKEIAEILAAYTKYNARRKPELLDANTYSVERGEWEQVVTAYKNILQKATVLNAKISPVYRDAYYQLVLHPVSASANLNELYYYVALNKNAFAKKWFIANEYAGKVKELFEKDSLITLKYHQINQGKWNHMMDQTHIGYTYWQQPPVNKIPETYTIAENEAKPVPPIMDSSRVSSENQVPKNTKRNLFFEEAAQVRIDAAHYTKAIQNKSIQWTILPDHGKTGDAITGFPVTQTIKELQPDGPHLEYEIYTYSKDSCSMLGYFSPTLNLWNNPNGLQFAISIDEEIPQKISLNKEDKNTGNGIWNKWVGENIIIKKSRHFILAPGKHTIKFWRLDPGIVVQKIMLDFGGPQAGYLGGEETLIK